jgi:hypothetical protein
MNSKLLFLVVLGLSLNLCAMDTTTTSTSSSDDSSSSSSSSNDSSGWAGWQKEPSKDESFWESLKK